MVTKLIRNIGAAITVTGVLLVWAPSDSSAISVSLGSWGNSITGDVTIATGGNPETDDFVTMIVRMKEITAFCVNPAFNAEPANGAPYTIDTVIAAAALGTWTKKDNGQFENQITITNQMIQEELDIYNAQHGNPFVFLMARQGLCKKNWNFLGHWVTKVDVQVADSKVPSVQNAAKEVVESGRASYQYETLSQCNNPSVTNDPNDVYDLSTHCRCVPIPQWNFVWDDGTVEGKPAGEDGVGDGSWDGKTYTYGKVCDLIGTPLTYCTRYDGDEVKTSESPTGEVADSGLRIYDVPSAVAVNEFNELDPLPIIDKTYKVKACFIFRDVNKDPSFDLTAFGTYTPDKDAIKDPQTGNPPVQQKVKGKLVEVSQSDSNLGGWVLPSVSGAAGAINYYQGECHQHGAENTNDKKYMWNQAGPAKTGCDGDIPTGDKYCTGGSILMTGDYPDPICPAP